MSWLQGHAKTLCAQSWPGPCPTGRRVEGERSDRRGKEREKGVAEGHAAISAFFLKIDYFTSRSGGKRSVLPLHPLL